MGSEEQWLETGRLAELGLMCSDLVHEVRQPLFAAKAQAQLLRSRASDEDAPLLDGLLEQLGNLERLIDRYSSTGRRVNGALQPMLLNAAAQASVELMDHRARHVHRLIELELGPEPHPVRADPVAVQQITCNLLTNAIDASRATVHVRVGNGLLEVIDDGPGIPAEVLGRIFEPFFSTKPYGRGTGLGLPITRRLVERLGATLTLETGEGGTHVAVAFVPWAGESGK